MQDSLIEVDNKQNCKGFKFRKQGLGGNKERIEWRYTRALDTCDASDYKIEEGTTHVVWTLGRGPLSLLSGLNVSDEVSVNWGMARTQISPFHRSGLRGPSFSLAFGLKSNCMLSRIKLPAC